MQESTTKTLSKSPNQAYLRQKYAAGSPVEEASQTKKPPASPGRPQSDFTGLPQSGLVASSPPVPANIDTDDFSQISYDLFERMKTFFLKTSDFLRKSYIIRYFFLHPNLLKLFDFEPAEFLDDIAAVQSERQNSMHVNEFIRFLETPRSVKSLDAVNAFLRRNPQKTVQKLLVYYQILDESQVQTLKRHFDRARDSGRLATTQDLVRLVEDLHRDLVNMDLLNSIAYYVDPVNRIITLSNILLDFRCEAICWRRGAADRSGADFGRPSWELFEDYFRDYTLRSQKPFQGVVSYAVMSVYKSENTIDFEHFEFVRSIFNSISDTCGFVETSELLMRLRLDDSLIPKLGLPIRRPQGGRPVEGSVAGRLELETLGEVLDRIENEAEEYIDFGEFQQYFSRRGYPM